MIQILTGINATASALDAERRRMEVISQNIANAHTTQGPDGKPYQKQKVVFEQVLMDQANGLPGGPNAPQTVRVARVEAEARAAKLVYMPGHPEADGNHMVALPDINIHEEMVDLIAASRAFEANLAVVKNARNMAVQTLSIGKR